MTLEAENAALRGEIEILTAQVTALREQVAALTAALHAAQARINEWEAKKTPPPAFVKANVPERPQEGAEKARP